MALKPSHPYKVLLKFQDSCIGGVAGPWLNPKNDVLLNTLRASAKELNDYASE